MTVRTRWLIVGAVLVLVAGVVGGVMWVRRGRAESVPMTVVLAAASDPGADPFVPASSDGPVPVALPPAGDQPAAVTASVDPDSGARMVSGTTARLYGGGSTDNAELYGGSGSLSACDPSAIAEFLAAHPDKAAAWAGVLGIETAGIAAFLNTLTPVVLLHDTLVTNHGFAGGVATPFVSVLQAGTAVLVDSTGIPVVRCACGNPLTAPPAVDLSAAGLQGARWDGYDPGGTVVVTAGPSRTELVVVDVATGGDRTVAPGAIPPAPATTAPTTPVITTAVGDTACVLDLTWPDASPGWIEPLDPAFTCQEMIDQWRRNEQWPGERGGTMAVVDFGDGWYCTGVHWDPTRPRTNAVGSCDLSGRRFNVYEGPAGVLTTVSTSPAPATDTTTALPGTGSAPEATDLMITPSQNLMCAVRDGQFACTLKEFDFDLGDERCPGARGPFVELDATGGSRASSCRGGFFDGITWPEPTPYGSTVTLAGIGCDVEQTGVTCTNPEGHGFTLSRSGITPF